jgi:hypothetical protein
MKILSIFFAFLFITNITFGQQTAVKDPRFSFKLGLNTTIARLSRMDSDIPAHWPGTSAPIGLLNPIFGFGKGWELSLPILVLNQNENWRAFNGELVKVDGQLRTNYQIGIGVEKVTILKAKLWNMPIFWGIGANVQVGKFTFEADAPVVFQKVTKQVAIEWFTGPRVLIKQWKHVFLDAQAYLVVRSNWDSIDFNQGAGSSTTIEPMSLPMRIQPRLGLGYRW